MAKYDVALQYFEDQNKLNGYVTETEIFSVFSKLNLTYEERKKIVFALKRKQIKVRLPRYMSLFEFPAVGMEHAKKDLKSVSLTVNMVIYCLEQNRQ